MRALRVAILLACLPPLIAACSALPKTQTTPVAQGTQPDIAQIVEATLSAMTAQASPGAPTSAPMATATSNATGAISGSLSYPADKLPPMIVAAYRVNAQDYRYVLTQPGQSTYTIDTLQPGVYHVIAYTIGGDGFPPGLAGGYTRAVPCGLATECANHTLIDVTVEPAKTTTGINPGDWYAPPGSFQPFPQMPPTPTGVAATASGPTAVGANGSISGTLMYPASSIPALRVVAFEVGAAHYYYTETSPGQSTYTIENIPPGTYHVVAYVLPGAGFPAGMAGGYSQAVPCGLQSMCNDHTLIDVTVTAGQTTTGVNPADFYAGSGTFPPDPLP